MDVHRNSIGGLEVSRYNAKIDGNHTDVVSVLRSVGAGVQSLASVGDGCPDLLVAFRGTWYVLEVKDGSLPPSRRTLTPAEQMWMLRFDEVAPVFVVNSADEALEVIGAV
jgi:hypothetical protein